ncbi:MAG: aminotransferase class III-fold pyridoxal phosphate-dependent enzyme, partial [Bdellovibrionaceae bacterium]|nr:aminotransferase class III-fold pyridoxal phosphate-dependent enzyme [Pseudobdellovibrionaceae bacterium]
MIYADDKGFQERLHTKIQELVQLIGEQSRHLTEVRAPQTSAEELGKAWRERTAQIRGRPLHYPFIGSGLGRGALVELMDGSVKLDFINGIGIHIFGHSHPKVMEAALWGALQDVVMQGNLEPNREYTLALEKLLELARPKSRLRYGWLATCGTMANESALKIARQKRGGARMIVAFENAFAGRSTLMAEITDNPAYREGLPEYHEVLRLPWYDKNNPRSAEITLAKFKEHVEKHGSNIGVFVFEPMLGCLLYTS